MLVCAHLCVAWANEGWKCVNDLNRFEMIMLHWSRRWQCKICWDRLLHPFQSPHHQNQSPSPSMLGFTIWSLFLHLDLSWAKSSNRLQFFKSIDTLFVHTLFSLSLFLGGAIVVVIASLYWICPKSKPSQMILSYFITYLCEPALKSTHVLLYPF